jgi:zinc D-Ala-D-Ala dipeptidase
MRGAIVKGSRRRIPVWVMLAVWLAVPAAFYAQGPPKEAGPFRAADLVDLGRLDRSIRLDIRYANSNNFLGRPVYTVARAFLQRPAAQAVLRANRALRKKGYGLLVFDGYRPWSVTKIFWDETPADKKEFVADPAQGSRHNRGCAVDLTLYDLKTGKEVAMPGAFDEMSERSHIDYKGGSEESRRLRDLLRDVMQAEGFAVYAPEWWHYDYKDWRQYAVLDIPFSAIRGRR